MVSEGHAIVVIARIFGLDGKIAAGDYNVFKVVMVLDLLKDASRRLRLSFCGFF